MASHPRVDRALELVDQLRELLDAAGLQDVMASMDANDVASGSRHGIVLVSPAVLTFPNSYQVDVSWEIHLIAGPPENYLEAWKVLDQLIEVLADGSRLPIDRAEPGQFQPLNGAPLWAFTLFLTE
jgi:hypothetical protein